MTYPRQPAGLWVSLACLFSIGFALSGCQPLNDKIMPIIAADAGQAAAMATASGALGRANCYGGWKVIAEAAGSGKGGGVFTTVETGFEVDQQIKSPDCNAIAGSILLWLARKAPLGGGLIP